MMPPPRLRDPIWLFLVAALLSAVAWKVTWLTDWLRTFFVFCALIFFLGGMFTAVNWLAFVSAERIREIGKAKIQGTYALALVLRGLSAKQTDIVARHDVVEIAGILGTDYIEWNIRAPGGDIPLEFMADFLKKSRETEPYLWPVRKHDELDWRDSEHLCTISTNLLIHSQAGWAEKASGPYSARLMTSLELVAAYFRVEL